jgi:hypothetical protein
LLTNLIRCLRSRDAIFLRFLCSQNISFEEFIPLMFFEADLLRPQCIYVFALLESVNEGPLNPYRHNQWIAGVISTMSTAGASAVFADIVYGEMFGVFDLRGHVLVPPVRRPFERMESMYVESPVLLPLVLFAIAGFLEALCTNYLRLIGRAVAVNARRRLGSVVRFFPDASRPDGREQSRLR